jgi:hypothetical protein
MVCKTLKVSDDFRNIRGSYKVAGFIDVGTQASLVRRGNGKFVFLDSYTLSTAVKREVDDLTHGGKDVEAILNLHPFHTVHVRKMHELFPKARLYGTARHLARFPGLPWEKDLTEEPALHRRFADDFEFSVPAGVDFISANENVHFSSVLAFHRASATIHSDDTLMYVNLPLLPALVGLSDAVTFHLTLAKALQKRPGAVQEFRDWAEGMIERWRDAENLCAAHTAALLRSNNRGASIHDRLRKALEKVDGTLQAHERKYG